MDITILKDYEKLSVHAAKLIIEQVQQKRDSVIVVPGGNTPLGMFRELAKSVKRNEADLSECTFIGLDEWVGLGETVEGGCRYTLNKHFYEPAQIKSSQIYFFDAKAVDLQVECQKMNQKIADVGGLDLIILGLGLNGHVGFNEPGIPWDLLCHVIELDEVTKTVANKYFPDGVVHIDRGITLGMKHISDGKHVVLMVNGEKKKDIVQKVVHNPVSPAVPASALQSHPNCSLIVDEACWTKK